MMIKQSPFSCWMTINCWEMLKIISFTTEIDFFGLDYIPGLRGYARWVRFLFYADFLFLCVFLPPSSPSLSQCLTFCGSLLPSAFFVFPTHLASLSRTSLLASVKLNGTISIFMMKHFREGKWHAQGFKARKQWNQKTGDARDKKRALETGVAVSPLLVHKVVTSEEFLHFKAGLQYQINNWISEEKKEKKVNSNYIHSVVLSGSCLAVRNTLYMEQ